MVGENSHPDRIHGPGTLHCPARWGRCQAGDFLVREKERQRMNLFASSQAKMYEFSGGKRNITHIDANIQIWRESFLAKLCVSICWYFTRLNLCMVKTKWTGTKHNHSSLWCIYGWTEIHTYTRDVYLVKKVNVRSYIMYKFNRQSDSYTPTWRKQKEDFISGMNEAYAHKNMNIMK